MNVKWRKIELISKRAKDLADFSYEEVWTLDKIYYDPQQPKSGKQWIVWFYIIMALQHVPKK